MFVTIFVLLGIDPETPPAQIVRTDSENIKIS